MGAESVGRRVQRSWYFYDWANSAYVTTTSTVLIGPYLTSVAKADACPNQAASAACDATVSLFGVGISPGSLVPYTVTASTIISAFLLLIIGAIADQLKHPARMLGVFAFLGAAAASAMYFVTGSNWQLGVLLLVVANQCLGASLIIYDALLIAIAAPDERDRVSSHGWALGYLGGGLLLAINLYLVMAHDSLGLTTAEAVRISLLSAGVWWAVFTLIPVLGLRHIRPAGEHRGTPLGRAVAGSFGQLRETFRHAKGYPNTLKFLLAYLFFNDGIQTVIASASIYGAEELRFTESQLIMTILLVQFVAFGGALLFGWIAGRVGAKQTVLVSLLIWCLVVLGAFFLPPQRFALWLALSVGIGLVLGGSQALSRSMYSRLIPTGREAEYFSLYQSMERGTSWLGTLTFGLVHQLTHSYRLSIIALVVFFTLGYVLLRRVNVIEGERAAAQPPAPSAVLG